MLLEHCRTPEWIMVGSIIIIMIIVSEYSFIADYLPEPGSSYAPHSTEGPYHHRPLHQSPSPQYHYPSHYQYAASYRPNLRGGLPALDQGGMYHSQQQYMRPG